MRRNVGGQFVGAQLNSKTDGSAVTSGTTTVYVTGDNGAQATGTVGSGAASHKGQGFWTYAPDQAETNYTHVAFTFANTNAVNATIQLYPTAYDANGRYDMGSVSGTAQTAGDIIGDTNDMQATLAAIAGYLDTEIAAIKAKTDNLPTDPADQSAVEAAILAAWTTALTESYRTNGNTGTPAQLMYEILAHLSEASIAGTTKTLKKLDHSTTAATLTLDDAVTPTSITRAT